MRCLVPLASLWLALSAAPTHGAEAVPAFEPGRYSQAVTDCDRLAAHPSDPNRVAPGVERKDMDFAAAIAACERAVRADPGNPRLNYQLARVYGYSGAGEKAAPHRQVAVDADYPQGVFVVGYLYLYGLNKVDKDVCRAAQLIRRSALLGRLSGQVGFVKWTLDGTFAACPVRQDLLELRGFLAAARQQAGEDFYQGLLIDMLERDAGVRQP